ncbi:MAG: hypothetical protein COX39_01505 [Candidatus Nealsonbacteria bacterium CG23_combo_of_CG06-09_8_20_14_all_40_13]|uniref:YbbR-like domain-containing protein n=1 Tax=Candidatus Nealsonbacteria bacterium CG23_combo_of_CG06-09_8_20_14_all_40_13 TaxID=1974724 RepID=A0A2G9YR53_9BACT|nr:MAG: hypothetical protein COX39_01505 [Candidatus Nealsonbacteria bacterium CG23_combo_of_CG06-09_8_20_14_all_40_13]PIR71001.1 MAG: hypothetical protein COU44_02020 [Candidatus Nealsonbacteria bacterium CG10_big_fil_rev_8_21_14_0_10_40_24]PIU43094.1 MAG: hypothetical protein COS97_02990 [Candidatus Nealsonbacteria bacterium CG07_land_8_20_14_0_80_40_10]
MKRITPLIVNNWQIKLLALFSALIFWFYVASSYAKIGSFPGTLPIEYRNLPANTVAISDSDNISIKLAADGIVWQRLSSSSFMAYVDLAGLSIGTHELEVKVDMSVSGVQIIEKKPAKILVRIEPKISKEVPVSVKIEGKPGEGFVTQTADVQPTKVTVSGAQSVLEKILEATAVVKLNGETEDKTTVSKLFALDNEGKQINHISFSPEEVKVTLPFSKYEDVKTVGISPIFAGQPASSYWISKVTVSPQTITISGSASALRTTNYLETMPIDIEGIADNKTKSASLKLPEHIGLVGDNSVKVYIEVSQTALSKEITATIKYQNLNANFNVSQVSPSSVKIVVTAAGDILQNISSSNTIVNLDLTGKQTGTFSIDISKNDISLPKDASVVSWLPSSLSITLQPK